jgi:hypothetical protein
MPLSLALVLLLLARLGAPTLISSSKLEHCVNSGANAEPIPCQMKFVVSMAIDSGQNNTETITASWQTAQGTDATGRPQVYRLNTPMRITVKKSRPLLRYPVTYRQTYNNKPRETVVYTGTLQCKDKSTDNNPTCGRAYDTAGKPILYSEGFCCDCSLCQLIGVCQSDSRANTNCALLGTGSAASCLTFDDLWYSGYNIGPAETWYTITVTITQPGGIGTQVLKVGPEVGLGALNVESGVVVRLVGDFAAFKQPINLEQRVLLIPSSPAGNPRVVAPTPTEWLFLDKSAFEDSGATCNKIGVSYEAFSGQGNRCKMKTGSCLGNQIDDYRQRDVTDRNNGGQGQYFVSSFGDFFVLDDGTGNTAGQPNNRPYIAYEVSNVQASLITLTFVADNISYTVNVATGVILSLNVTEVFEANSNDGALLVTVLNTGQVPADFYLTVNDCTNGTFPIQTVLVPSLLPSGLYTAKFRIFSEMLKGQVNRCNVTLRDALQRFLDTRWVKWNTTDTIVNQGAQGGTGNGANGTPVLPPPTMRPPPGNGACTDCPFYNPVCFVAKSCFWQVVVQILVVIAILTIIFCVLKNHKAIFSCCREKDKDNYRKEQAENNNERSRRMHPEGRAQPPPQVVTYYHVDPFAVPVEPVRASRRSSLHPEDQGYCDPSVTPHRHTSVPRQDCGSVDHYPTNPSLPNLRSHYPQPIPPERLGRTGHSHRKVRSASQQRSSTPRKDGYPTPWVVG